MREKLQGFPFIVTEVPDLEKEFMKAGSIEIGRNQIPLSLVEVQGGVEVNGTFIRACDRIEVAEFLMGRK